MMMKIVALLCVDVSPRWMYGHTLQDSEDEAYANATEMREAMAFAHRRIAALMQHVVNREDPLTPIVVESEHLNRLRLSDLRHAGGMALCGVYGDSCVLDVALRLKRRGYSVAILADACLWSYPIDQIDDPRLKQIDQRRAVELFPELLDDDPALWSDSPPSF